MGFWGLLCLYVLAAGDIGGIWALSCSPSHVLHHLGFFFRMYTEPA